METISGSTHQANHRTSGAAARSDAQAAILKQVAFAAIAGDHVHPLNAAVRAALDEVDVDAGGYGAVVEAVAGIGEICVGQGKNETAVADAVASALTENQIVAFILSFLIILALLILMRVLERLGITALLTRLLRPVLTLLGISERAAPLAIIGMTLGLTYGGGLIIQEARAGHLSRHDVFCALALLGICHSFIEDTLLMVVIGGHLSGTLGKGPEAREVLGSRDEAELPHPGGHQQGHGRQGSGIDYGNGGNIEAGRGDVIAADGGGIPGPQAFLLAFAAHAQPATALRAGGDAHVERAAGQVDGHDGAQRRLPGCNRQGEVQVAAVRPQARVRPEGDFEQQVAR